MLELLIAELDNYEKPFIEGKLINRSMFDLGYVAGLKKAIEILKGDK